MFRRAFGGARNDLLLLACPVVMALKRLHLVQGKRRALPVTSFAVAVLLSRLKVLIVFI